MMMMIIICYQHSHTHSHKSYYDLGMDLNTHPRPILRSSKMILLDKIDDIAKKGIHFELGGTISKSELNDSIGTVYYTRFEKKRKYICIYYMKINIRK